MLCGRYYSLVLNHPFIRRKYLGDSLAACTGTAEQYPRRNRRKNMGWKEKSMRWAEMVPIVLLMPYFG